MGNHVLSWDHIRDKLSDTLEELKEWKKKRNELPHIDWINDLFMVDNKARVNIDGIQFERGKKVTKFVRKPHSEYLRQGVRNKKNLIQINKEFKNQVRQNIRKIDFQNGRSKRENCEQIEEMMKSLNAAPANLRYGDSHINSGIGKRFDPMGDKNGVLTTKEKKWL